MKLKTELWTGGFPPRAQIKSAVVGPLFSRLWGSHKVLFLVNAEVDKSASRPLMKQLTLVLFTTSALQMNCVPTRVVYHGKCLTGCHYLLAGGAGDLVHATHTFLISVGVWGNFRLLLYSKLTFGTIWHPS